MIKNKTEKQAVSSELLTELLSFVGYTGLATVDQCEYSLRQNFTEEELIEAISFAIRNRYLWEATGLPLKRHAKMILYLTNTGHDRLRKLNRQLAGISVSGNPDKNKKMFNDAARSLLIIESLLYWQRTHNVILFITERRLTNEDIRLQWTNWRDRFDPKFADEFAGDYKIIVSNLKTHAVKIHECAVAVKPQIEFLRRLPMNIIWFTTSAATAGKINLYTAKQPEILDPLTVERGEELTEIAREILENSRIRTPSTKLNETDSSILNALEQTGMTLNLDDLETLICTNEDSSDTCRNSLRNARTKLLRSDLVRAREGKTRPGYGFGKPSQYIFLPENEELFREKLFQRHIILSFVLRHELKKGRRFFGFDAKIPALTMELRGERITYLSDYADGEHDDFVTATVEDYKNFNDQNGCLTRLVVVDFSRQDKILKRLRPENLLSLCELFDGYV
jgi:hypothetical protein